MKNYFAYVSLIGPRAKNVVNHAEIKVKNNNKRDCTQEIYCDGRDCIKMLL